MCFFFSQYKIEKQKAEHVEKIWGAQIWHVCVCFFACHILWSRPPAGYPPDGMVKIKPYISVICLLSTHSSVVKYYTICKDYDSMNQHSHPSTTTPPTPTGRGGEP